VRLSILSSCLLIAACTDSGNTVNIYNWSDYIGETTLEDFTAATGIATRYDLYDSNDVLEAKLLAGGSGYDIVVPASEPYFERQIKAGIYQPLDKSKLPNLKFLDPDLMDKVSAADPGNAHGVIYQYGTTGFGYNVDKIEARMPDAPIDSFDMLFKPEIVASFADCGVTMLDAANEVIPLVLNYLGLDPNSEDAADLQSAEAVLTAVRPYIRYFHSSQYINDLASGETCLAIGWSGDVIQARTRGEEAQDPQRIAYVIPQEGTMLWFDMLAIPKDAPNPDAALAWINFVLEPEVMAGITNYVAYANAVPNSLQYVDEEIRNDPTIFPTPEVRSRLFVQRVPSPEADRERNRAWTRIKSGQ